MSKLLEILADGEPNSFKKLTALSQKVDLEMGPPGARQMHDRPRQARRGLT